VQAYYIGQWIVARRGNVPEALALTREGLAANPRSGLLRASYAQMLLLFAKDKKGADEWAVKALAPDAVWVSDDEKFQGYAILKDVLKIAGDPSAADRARAVWQHLKDEGKTLEDTDEAPQGSGGSAPKAP
jgi:predicted Zn-dependent protease